MDAILSAIMNVSPLEWAANLFTLMCIFLAGRNSVHTWWTGIVACTLFGFLFFEYKLYADVALQVFFVGTSIYGWYWWADTKNKPAAPISAVYDTRYTFAGLVLAAVVWFGYSTALHLLTDASLPFVDSAVLVLSIIGQLLMMRRHLANWVFWIAVNAVATPLFFYKELYLTAAFYFVYFFHAIYALKVWNREFWGQEHGT